MTAKWFKATVKETINGSFPEGAIAFVKVFEAENLRVDEVGQEVFSVDRHVVVFNGQYSAAVIDMNEAKTHLQSHRNGGKVAYLDAQHNATIDNKYRLYRSG